jgi:rhamnosyltransferase
MISIVIPVKNGGSDLRRCLAAIEQQSVDEEVEIVIVDSGSSDDSVDIARSFGATVIEIPAAEFTHGGSRNLGASHAAGDLLVFTSQDTCAIGRDWLARLRAPFLGDEKLAGVYGRQVPYPDARPPEEYFLGFLYGEAPRAQQASSAAELSMETTLFSNVNSAMRRAVWQEFRFVDDLIMSEDQEWCARVLLAGWTVRYEPDAAVLHSHRYSLLSAARRFFDSGVSAERTYLAGSSPSSAVLRRTARSYALGELAWLWRTGKRRWIPYACAYETCKLIGLQLGVRHRHLPLWLKRRFSLHTGFW